MKLFLVLLLVPIAKPLSMLYFGTRSGRRFRVTLFWSLASRPTRVWRSARNLPLSSARFPFAPSLRWVPPLRTMWKRSVRFICMQIVVVRRNLLKKSRRNTRTTNGTANPRLLSAFPRRPWHTLLRWVLLQVLDPPPILKRRCPSHNLFGCLRFHNQSGSCVSACHWPKSFLCGFALWKHKNIILLQYTATLLFILEVIDIKSCRGFRQSIYSLGDLRTWILRIPRKYLSMKEGPLPSFTRNSSAPPISSTLSNESFNQTRRHLRKTCTLEAAHLWHPSQQTAQEDPARHRVYNRPSLDVGLRIQWRHDWPRTFLDCYWWNCQGVTPLTLVDGFSNPTERWLFVKQILNRVFSRAQTARDRVIYPLRSTKNREKQSPCVRHWMMCLYIDCHMVPIRFWVFAL